MGFLHTIPLCVPCFLHGDVRQHCVPNVAGLQRGRIAQGDHKVVMVIQPSVELGIYRPNSAGLGRTVQLRVLQPDVKLDPDWLVCYGFISSKNMVLFLPYGDDDADDLQGQKRGREACIKAEPTCYSQHS